MILVEEGSDCDNDLFLVAFFFLIILTLFVCLFCKWIFHPFYKDNNNNNKKKRNNKRGYTRTRSKATTTEYNSSIFRNTHTYIYIYIRKTTTACRMYSLEFVSGRPSGSSQYYSLVVREPYMVGRARGSDIMLDCDDIAEKHALLSVMRESQALEDQQRRLVRGKMSTSHVDNVEDMDGLDGGVLGSFLNSARDDTDGVVAWNTPDTNSTLYAESGENDEYGSDGDIHTREEGLPPENLGKRGFSSLLLPKTDVLRGNDPLVVCVVKPTGGGGRVLANETELMDNPVYLADGAQVQFGDKIRLRLSFRPLVVSIARNIFTSDRVRELEFMYHSLGATLTRSCGPTRHLDIPKPIGMLHCVEVISDDVWCLMALANGYSIVHPGYVLEWFAALAQSASSPLSLLPPPTRFEVPIQFCFSAKPHAAFYLRPESDICPFPLYAIPTTATLKRSRDSLFRGLKFFFPTNAVELRYKAVVPLCGGEVHCPEDAMSVAAEALRKKADDDRGYHNSNVGFWNRNDRRAKGSSVVSHYIVVDIAMEDAMHSFDARGLAAVQHILDSTGRLGVVFLVISERSLFYSLLTNKFTAFEVSWPFAPDVSDCQQQQGQGNSSAKLCAKNPQKNVNPHAIGQSCGVFDPLDTLASTKNLGRPQRRVMVERSEQARSISKMTGVAEAVVHRARVFFAKEHSKLDMEIAAVRRGCSPSEHSLDHARECSVQSKNHIDGLNFLLSEGAESLANAKHIVSCLLDCRAILRKAKWIIERACYTARRMPLADCARCTFADSVSSHQRWTSLSRCAQCRVTSFEGEEHHAIGVRRTSLPSLSTLKLCTPGKTGRVATATPRPSSVTRSGGPSRQVPLSAHLKDGGGCSIKNKTMFCTPIALTSRAANKTPASTRVRGRVKRVPGATLSHDIYDAGPALSTQRVTNSARRPSSFGVASRRKSGDKQCLSAIRTMVVL